MRLRNSNKTIFIYNIKHTKTARSRLVAGLQLFNLQKLSIH